MYKVVILGSNSQISKDIIIKFYRKKFNLFLFSSNKKNLIKWLKQKELSRNIKVLEYSKFGKEDYNLIINFIGSSDPNKTNNLTKLDYDIYNKYDDMVLNFLKTNPSCKYIFISSGIICKSEKLRFLNLSFSLSTFLRNKTYWYKKTKIDIENKHRNFSDRNIVDLRIYSYVGQNIDLASELFLSQIIRAIRKSITLEVSPINFRRDYLHEDDLFNIIQKIIETKRLNIPLDCFSRKPVEKFTLLENLKLKYNLKYIVKSKNFFKKKILTDNYFSLNRDAKEIGYNPKFNSEDGIMDILKKIQNG